MESCMIEIEVSPFMKQQTSQRRRIELTVEIKVGLNEHEVKWNLEIRHSSSAACQLTRSVEPFSSSYIIHSSINSYQYTAIWLISIVGFEFSDSKISAKFWQLRFARWWWFRCLLTFEDFVHKKRDDRDQGKVQGATNDFLDNAIYETNFFCWFFLVCHFVTIPEFNLHWISYHAIYNTRSLFHTPSLLGQKMKFNFGINEIKFCFLKKLSKCSFNLTCLINWRQNKETTWTLRLCTTPATSLGKVHKTTDELNKFLFLVVVRNVVSTLHHRNFVFNFTTFCIINYN